MEKNSENQCFECEHCSENYIDDYDKGKIAYCKLIGCLVKYYENACKCFRK